MDDQGVALVTGSGSGIGSAIAQKLGEHGWTVFVVDVAETPAAATATSIRDAGGDARFAVADVRDGDAVSRAVDGCIDELGRLDVLVNNAGIMDRFLPAHECPDDVWEAVIDVNLNGAFRMTRAALLPMLEAGSGHVINIVSVAGLTGGRGGTAYTASKHGLLGLTRSVAWMYAEQGVRSNAVCPGGVDTGIGARSGVPSEFGHQRVLDSLQTCPRYGEPDEIADVALFLASPAARFVNGAAITVDAGWTAG